MLLDYDNRVLAIKLETPQDSQPLRVMQTLLVLRLRGLDSMMGLPATVALLRGLVACEKHAARPCASSKVDTPG